VTLVPAHCYSALVRITQPADAQRSTDTVPMPTGPCNTTTTPPGPHKPKHNRQTDQWLFKKGSTWGKTTLCYQTEPSGSQTPRWSFRSRWRTEGTHYI